MYDFYFGTKEEIEADEEKFLVSIKRMLPKWCNSIPDSEYIALYRVGDNLCKDLNHPPVIVEVGTGASSIVMAFLAIKYGGTLYTWDINGEKGSFMRGVINETICNYKDANINKNWKFIPYDSCSPYLGIPILKEMENHVDMIFLDGEHTLHAVKKEIELVNPMLIDGSVVSMDDANYNCMHINIDYINLFRKKLGLNKVKITNNTSDLFNTEIKNFLKEKWEKVLTLETSYPSDCRKDLFFDYYNTETLVRSKMEVEKIENLENRFGAWWLYDRKNPNIK